MKRVGALLVGLAVASAIWGCSRADSVPRLARLAVSDEGFSPLRVEAREGEELTLLVTRTSASSCAKQIIIPALGIRRELPVRQEVSISFTPQKRGALQYTCCDEMVGGSIVVR